MDERRRAAWSGGKDSALALWALREELDTEPVALITTFTPNREAAALSDRLPSSIGAAATVHSAGYVHWPGWGEVTIQHRAASLSPALSRP